MLEQRGGSEGWMERARNVTDVDGRIADFLPSKALLEPGIYRLRFDTGGYFLTLGVPTFYPEVHVIVHLEEPAAHYHIPLLLSPYGYSTYRGS